MQNLLLFHLREQKGLSVKELEQRTGISPNQYTEYEQGASSISDTDCELLSALFKIKPIYLREYSRQLEYFTYAKSMLELKDKRIEELVTVLKLYIQKESKPKQLKHKQSTSK
jgi:transcriptional regulator with XRE-family HTH domain